ncbi:MAG: glycosyltransferase, partial [Promethearchaeota archaeon]
YSGKEKPIEHLKKKIMWVTFLILDAQLHKTSQFEILGNLSKKGYNTTLIAIQSKNIFLSKNSQVSVISIPLRNKPLITSIIYAVFIFFFLPFYILISKPDFIVIQPTIPITSFIPLIPIFRILRIKLILDIRTIPVQTGLRGVLHNLLFKSSIIMSKKIFDGMTVITSPMRNELCRKYGIHPEKLGIWSSGVSPTLFNPKKWISEGSRVRKKLKLTHRFVIFYHGAFSENRGLVETIKAIALLKQVNPEVLFFLLGSGPLTSVLKETVQKEKLQKNIIIHDPVAYEDVPKYISMCDLPIIPLPNMYYWRFQSPLKLLEYLAMKKTVIVSDIPAHRSILDDESCAIYVSSIKPNEIAKSIIFCLNNRDKLQKWGKIGRKIVEKGYTWQKVASDLENYLLSIN